MGWGEENVDEWGEPADQGGWGNQDWGEGGWGNQEWVEPEPDEPLIVDAFLLNDDPAPPTINQLWEIGDREEKALEADPKEYILRVLQHDMDEVKDGGFPGLRAYIRLSCTWEGKEAIPYAQRLFASLLTKSRSLTDKTINVGDKRKILNTLLANMNTAKLQYPQDAQGAGLSMLWTMVSGILMREASSYQSPDPEECVPTPGAWPFLHDGATVLSDAVVLRLEKPNDSNWYKLSKWILEQVATLDWKVEATEGVPISWMPLNLCFSGVADEFDKRKYEFPESVRIMEPTGSIVAVEAKDAVGKMMAKALLACPADDSPERDINFLYGKALKKEIISRMPKLMLVSKQISAGTASGSDQVLEGGTAVERYEKRMRFGPWLTELGSAVEAAHYATNTKMAGLLNLNFSRPDLQLKSEELSMTVKDLLMMSHLSTPVIVEDVHFTEIKRFIPRRQLPVLQPLHVTSELGDWRKLYGESLWDSSPMIRAFLRGRINKKRSRMMMHDMGMGGMGDFAMADLVDDFKGGKGGKKVDPVSSLVASDAMPFSIFATIMLGFVVEYDEGQEHLEVPDERLHGGMSMPGMPRGRRGGKRGGKKGRKAKWGREMGMMGMDGFNMGGDDSDKTTVYSNYLLEWEAPLDPEGAEAQEAAKTKKKDPRMIVIRDTPQRGPVSDDEFLDAASKEPEALPPCRAGKVIQSNPWRWPNLWDDDDSTQYQYFLWGASLRNFLTEHGQQLHGGGMAGGLGASRGLGHFRYIGIPVDPSGASVEEVMQAITAQFAKATDLVLQGYDVHVPEHWTHEIKIHQDKRGMMERMIGGGGGSAGIICYTLSKHGDNGLTGMLNELPSLSDAQRIQISELVTAETIALNKVAAARTKQANDATVRESLLQMHDKHWRERFSYIAGGEFDFTTVGTGSAADNDKVGENIVLWLKHLDALRGMLAKLQPAIKANAELDDMQRHLECNLELGLLAFRHIHSLTHNAQAAAEDKKNPLKSEARARHELELALLSNADAVLEGMVAQFVREFPAFQDQFSEAFEKAPGQFEFLMKAAIRSFFLAGAHEGNATSEWITIAFQAQINAIRKAQGVQSGENDPVVAVIRGIKITKHHAETADPGTWLTGDMINFWFAALEEKATEGNKKMSVVLLQPTAANVISLDANDANMAGVFLEPLGFNDAELVVIPVNDSDGKSGGEHWSTMLYHKETNGFYVLDSLGVGDHANDAARRYGRKFQDYVTKIGRPGSTLSVIRIPKQKNLCDCGVFICAIAALATNAGNDFGIFFDADKLKSGLVGGNMAGMRAEMQDAIAEYALGAAPRVAGAEAENVPEQAIEARVMELFFLVRMEPKVAMSYLEKCGGSVEKVVEALCTQQQSRGLF